MAGILRRFAPQNDRIGNDRLYKNDGLQRIDRAADRNNKLDVSKFIQGGNHEKRERHSHQL